MADELYEPYAGLLGEHFILAVRTLIGVVRSAFGYFSTGLRRFLRSLVPPRRPTAISGVPSLSQQQLACAQEEIEAARPLAQCQVTHLPSALGFSNQPSISGSSTHATVGAIEVNNNAHHLSDEETEMKEESIEMAITAGTSNVNSNNDEEEEETTGRDKEASEDVYLNEVSGNSVDETGSMQMMEEDEEMMETHSLDNTKEQQSEAVMNEANSERDQAGPSIVSSPVSTVTRRSTRVSAAMKVNYSEAKETSVIDVQQVTLQKRASKRKRAKHTDNVPVPKRLRRNPVVAADDAEEDTSEAVSLSVTVLHLKCPETGCKEKLPNQVQLNQHLLAKHQIEQFDCKVKDCGITFATQSELNGHRKSAHRRLKNWPCAQCETICKTYNKLALHFADYHQQGQFGCSAERCTFTDTTRKRVRHHQTGKHRRRKHHCTFAGCTLSFNRSSHLADHRLVHTKEKHFACDQCSKAFTQKTHLTRHVRVHSGLKPYHCTWPQCDHASSDGSSVRKHVRQVHFGLPSSKKEQAERRIIDNRDAGEFVEKRTSD